MKTDQQLLILIYALTSQAQDTVGVIGEFLATPCQSLQAKLPTTQFRLTTAAHKLCEYLRELEWGDDSITCIACSGLPNLVKNWHPVVGDLLVRLQKSGFELLNVDDGGDQDEIVRLSGTPRERRQAAKSAICSVDESSLQVLTPNKKIVWIDIVLDEQPFDIVNDYTGEELDQVTNEFAGFWADRKCPEKHLKK